MLHRLRSPGRTPTTPGPVIRAAAAAGAALLLALGLTQGMSVVGGRSSEAHLTGAAPSRIDAAGSIGGGPSRLGPPSLGPRPLAQAIPRRSAPAARSRARKPIPAVRPTSAPEHGIAGPLVGAYRSAAKVMSKERPGCGLRWTLLAGVGRIESDHAQGGAFDATGRMVVPFVGPRLDGAGPFAEIRDSDKGRWDGDKTYDRAIGPMQFLPETWRSFGRDGDRDGVTDAQNIYDATLSAAGYLCAAGEDLRTREGLQRALFAYNPSWDYVTDVLTWFGVYADIDPTDLMPTQKPTATPTPTRTPTPKPTPVTPPGTRVPKAVNDLLDLLRSPRV